MLGDVTFWGAALAGLIAFFTPCMLPMVPLYLSYMGGVSVNELKSEGEIGPGAAKRLIISAIMYSLGVITIFMLLGMGASAIGQAFGQWIDTLRYVAAAVILVFGLHFLGVFKIGFLMREARIDSKADPATVLGAYLMGLASGFAWTACVGPVLASILMIASGMGDVTKGALLLAAFGVGMTAPFVFAAIFAKQFLGWMQRNRSIVGHAEKVMGAIMLVFAVLIATNSVSIISNWMIKVIPSFQTLG